MIKPLLLQTQLDHTPITSAQYFEYTPEKLELWDGFRKILLSDAENLIKRGF